MGDTPRSDYLISNEPVPFVARFLMRQLEREVKEWKHVAALLAAAIGKNNEGDICVALDKFRTLNQE